MNSFTMQINNLNCASCAGKIEKSLGKLEYINDVYINMATSQITISMPSSSPDSHISELNSIIKEIEHDVFISPTNKAAYKNINYIPIAISVFLAIIGLIFKESDAAILLYGASTILAGYKMFIKSLKKLVKLSFDENVLLTIAAISAFIIGEYFEAAVVVILFTIGMELEGIAVEKSRKSISAITRIIPENANLLSGNGQIMVVPAKDLKIDDAIVIKAGERVPVDCIVKSGSSSIDKSALTGESMPELTEMGDLVLSGSINIDGLLTCNVVKPLSESTATKIIELVEQSAAKKSQCESFITRFAKYYTPIIIIISIFVAAIPIYTGYFTAEQAIYNALVFLVASCPCALVISVPLGFFSAIGACAKKGVLIKGSKYLENLSKTDAIVFDKTGTLTKAKLSVKNITSLVDNLSNDTVLQIIATAEIMSNHPIALAVVNHYKTLFNNTPDYAIQNIAEIAGRGMKFNIQDSEALCGSIRLMSDNNISFDDVNANIYLAIDGIPIGYVILEDTIKDDAGTIVQGLKDIGIFKTVMLTGDTYSSAKHIADSCNISEFYSDLLPQDKVRHVEQLKLNQKYLTFIGDGINDAPVLSIADIGISIGLGSDIAIDSSDIVLMSNNLSPIVDVIKISKKSINIIRFNILFALLVKAIVLILGAAGMAPIFVAVLADVGVTVLSILNSTRILRFK